MLTLRVDAADPDAGAIERAAGVIRQGGLVAFPTETVYGLGANALDEAAVRRIFAAKGRPAFNPVIAHVPELAAARSYASRWPGMAERLGAAFWPGPLTLVVPKREDIPEVVTAGLASVGLRVPAHPVALALLRAAGVPVAAPSANRYTEISPTAAGHVAKGLAGRIDLLLDGGATEVGIESTVVDVTGEEPVLLRPGSISRAQLEEVLGPVREEAGPGGNEARRAPGMVERHYAPRGELRVFAAARRPEMAEVAAEALARGWRVGGLLLEPIGADLTRQFQMPHEPAGYARHLYSALHALDDQGCRLIVADAVPEDPEWTGIRDRLKRAARRD